MTALPGHGGTPRPAPPRDDTEDLGDLVDVALTAAHNVERQLKRDIAAGGVTEVSRRLGVSRATVSRIRDGGWPVTGALRKLRGALD